MIQMIALHPGVHRMLASPMGRLSNPQRPQGLSRMDLTGGRLFVLAHGLMDTQTTCHEKEKGEKGHIIIKER
jgi:hypothetical protein